MAHTKAVATSVYINLSNTKTNSSSHMYTLSQCKSCRKCPRKIQTTFPGSAVPSTATTYRTVSKIRANGNSVKTKGESWERRVLTGESVYGIGAGLEASWNTRLRRLALQCRTSGSRVHVATKCLKLRPTKTAAVHGLPPPYCEPRIWYCTQSHLSLFTHLLETQFTLYSEEALFTFSGYINSRNNTQCSIEIPHMVLGDSSHGFKVQMLCRIWKANNRTNFWTKQ